MATESGDPVQKSYSRFQFNGNHATNSLQIYMTTLSFQITAFLNTECSQFSFASLHKMNSNEKITSKFEEPPLKFESSSFELIKQFQCKIFSVSLSGSEPEIHRCGDTRNMSLDKILMLPAFVIYQWFTLKNSTGF